MKDLQKRWIWKEVELGEICEVLTGFAFKSNLFNEEGKGKLLIRIRDLLEGKSKTYYSGEFEEKYLVKAGDFLIGMDGEFKIFEWKSEDALLNQRVCKLILNKDLVFPKYIFYRISKELKEIEDKTPFVTVKHISNKQILSIKIPLPHISTQKQIVSILEKAEKLKQKRGEADKLTKEYLQSVFYEMFYNKRFEEVELGEICEIKKGTSITKDTITNGTVPVIAGGQQAAYYHNTSNRTGETLTVSGSGAYAGFVAYFNIPIFASDCSTIQVKDKKIQMIYIYYFLKTNQTKIYKMQKGIAQPHVYPKDLENIKIPLPPLPLQQKFASIVEQVEKLKEKQKQSKENINNLFNSLMQRAFNGELIR